MRGRPMPRSATLGTVIVRARRETQPGRPSSCRTSIGSLATSRLGSLAPTTASATTTSRCTSTSSPSASTAGGPRWPPSRPSSVSPPASTARRPTTCCTVRSQPDRQNACYGLFGPKAREILARATRDDVSDAALPYMSARRLTVGNANVLALRVTYVGELGWELYTPTAEGLALWDALWAAGSPVGMLAAGYRAIDSLR